MGQQSERTTYNKTYKEKLRPTPAQERALDDVLWRCRLLYNAALEQRITAWRRCHVSVTRFAQEAELKDIRAAMPEYAAVHSHVLQDVLARLDRTYQAFFRRVATGKKAGFPRFQGRNRYHSFTYKEYGNGARLDNGCLVLSKIGRIAVRWSRPIAGTSKTVTISREADGWYVCCSCAEVPAEPLPLTGKETGIDVGLKVFLVTAGTSSRIRATTARPSARCRRRSGACPAGRRGAIAGRKPPSSAPSSTSTSAGSGPTSTTRPRWRWSGGMIRSRTRLSRSPISVAVPLHYRMGTAAISRTGLAARRP
jgi:putative transposase